MATRFTLSLVAFSCLVLTSFVSADVIEGTAIFANNELSDANDSVSSTLTITDSGIIKSIAVTINGLNHTSAGDLIAELRYLGPGAGGPSGPGGEPAYLFFRPLVAGQPIQGSEANLNGNYRFDDEGTQDYWDEAASTQNDETIDDQLSYLPSDENGLFNDLGGVGGGFFGGFDVAGDWELIITDANTGIAENNDGTVTGWTIEFHVQPIPEPGTTIVLTILGGLGAFRRRRVAA